MKYSRKQIDKAGDALTSSKEHSEVEAATLLINDWRFHHLFVSLIPQPFSLTLFNWVGGKCYS